MRTIEKTIYKYEELSDEAKKTALIQFGNEEYPYIDLKDTLKYYLQDSIGDNELKLYYSLSHCQGDGVAFEGALSINNVINIVKLNKKDLKIIEQFNCTFEIKHHGRYYHENSMSVLCRWHAEEGNTKAFEIMDNLIEKLENRIIELSKELSLVGYREIDYLISEEHFIEICELNEWEFYEDGYMV